MPRVHDLWLPPLPSLYVPPALLQIEAGASIGGGGDGGMIWRGAWDREDGYRVEDVVRYKGKAYVCVQAVPEKNLITGPGPNPGSINKNNIFFPEGRPKPVGRIASGEENESTLTKVSIPGKPEEEGEPAIPEKAASAKMEQYNHTMQQGWRADIWEIWLKESEVNAELTLEKFTVAPPAGSSPVVKGSYRPYVANDNGTKSYAEVAFSTFAGGSQGIKSLGGEMPEAAKEAGAVRFYLVLFGGQFTYQEPFRPIISGETLPLPYLFVVKGAAIVAPPGNLTPEEDPIHWRILSNA